MTDTAAPITLRNARLDDGRTVDVRLAEGRIAAIEAPGGGDGIDLGGALLLPGLHDGHVHLDKTLLGLPWTPHRPDGTVRGRIEAEKAILRGLEEPLAVRARRMIDHVVARGTTSMRCHVDVDGEIGVERAATLLQVREAVRHLVDIQLVAFPQSGVVVEPGAAALLDGVLAMGVDVVGGLDPAGIDEAVEAQLDVVFGLAQKHGKPVDIHLHDPGELGCYQLRRIAQRSAGLGMQGKVAVSHAFALGHAAPDTFERTAAALAAGGVAIMTNGPGPETIPPISRLTARGVTVFVGSDNIRDAWSPYGTGDMLDRARLVGYRAALLTDAELRLAFDLVTRNVARVTGAPCPTVAVGAPADLIAVDAIHVPEAVASAPPRRLVVKAGRIVARDGRLLG